MKKRYVKPELFVDHFELSQNIALGCVVVYGAMSSSPSSCAWMDGFDSVFINAKCDLLLESEDSYWGACYHNLDSSNTIFSS